MRKLYFHPRCYLGVTFFRWGVYMQLRVGRRWKHVKVGWWLQRGLRVSTRRQVKQLRKKPRYVSAMRFNLSYWSTSYGKAGAPRNFGMMVYWGKTK